MELWRDTIEFQGIYQLLNVSNPALAFGKLKWIFSGRCFSRQSDSPPAFVLQTQRGGENNCYSAVKYSIEIQKLDVRINSFCKFVLQTERLRLHVRISVVNASSRFSATAALSLAGSAVSPARRPSATIRAST